MPDVQFLSVLEQMTPSEALVSSLIFHQVQPGGALVAHGAQLHGIKMSDSAFSQRHQLLPVEFVEQIMLVAPHVRAASAKLRWSAWWSWESVRHWRRWPRQ